ncbi:MAG: tetratricopeptide repeat protein [Planctomycetes bacterium]|nr:tetratricopeptide repeat protein [Planctomycetota bacterium]
MRFTVRSAVACVLVASSTAFVACSTTNTNDIHESAQAPTRRADAEPNADELFRAGRWAEAATAYRARIAAHPDDGQAWHHLGYALHVQGELDAAIEAHRRASEFPAQRAPSLYNLACAQALKGDAEAAFHALDGALAAGFRDATLLSNDSDLASLRGDPRFAACVARARGEPGGRHRELDFWVGEWDVFDPSGQLVGTNSITKAERGYVLCERWTDRSGGSGRSLNFVDPSDGLWKQVWVDDRGGVMRYSGAFVDGALRFEGEHLAPHDVRTPSRCTFTPLADGSVRQFIEQRAPDGVWRPAFDGKYVRRSTTAAAAN